MSLASYQLLHSAILFLKCVAKVRLYFVRNKYFLNKFEKTRFRKYSEAWQSFVEIIYIKCQYFRGSTSVLSREYCCTLAEVLEYSAGNIVECKGRLSFFVYKKKQCPDEIQADVSSGCILFPGIFKYLFIPIAYRFKFGFFSTSLGG